MRSTMRPMINRLLVSTSRKMSTIHETWLIVTPKYWEMAGREMFTT